MTAPTRDRCGASVASHEIANCEPCRAELHLEILRFREFLRAAVEKEAEQARPRGAPLLCDQNVHSPPTWARRDSLARPLADLRVHLPFRVRKPKGDTVMRRWLPLVALLAVACIEYGITGSTRRVASVEVFFASGLTSPTVPGGATLEITATTWDSRGQPTTPRTVTWSSSDVAVATVQSTTDSLSGFSTADVTAQLIAGTTPVFVKITATSEGVSGFAWLTVTPPPVAP